MAFLSKELGLSHVFSVAAGAMISSGLFVLPAIAFSQAGPALVLSYLFAAILILPSVLAKAELSTAMPKAGGTYFYVERSMGTIWGLFSGFASWFSLALKSAFAIIGVAIFLKVLVERFFAGSISETQIKWIAVVGIAAFGALNVVSVRQTGRFQNMLVALLLSLLALFVFFGAGYTKSARFAGFLDEGWRAVFATTGLVFISYGGITKIASIAEEIKNPRRNLPLGMLLAWSLVSVLYVAVVAVTIGLLERGELSPENPIPISLAAGKFMGPIGFLLMGLAAVAAFITTANGGILASSRSPMAMSRDQLLPSQLAHISSRFKTPDLSIILTCLFMIVAVVFLDISTLVKTASTLMIILFLLTNASVIIMRESKIQSYRPAFKAPLYPYLQIVTIIAYAALIIDMGRIPLLISACFVAASAAWYLLYASRRVSRASAVMHIVERVTDHELGEVTLENELRDILIERDNITEDRFDKLIRQCPIIDMPEEKTSEEVFRIVSETLAMRLDENEYLLFEKFLRRESEGVTVVQPGLAIPHIVVEGEHKFDIMLVRALKGIRFPGTPEPVRMMFVLAGTRDERNYHLRALMAVAQIVQEKNFEPQWMKARDIETLRNLILLSARKRDLGGTEN